MYMYIILCRTTVNKREIETVVCRVHGNFINAAQQTDASRLNANLIDTEQQTDVIRINGNLSNTAQQTEVCSVNGNSINSALQTDVSRTNGTSINTAQQTDASRESGNSSNTAQQTDVGRVSGNPINTAQQTYVCSVSGNLINAAQQTDVCSVSGNSINTAQQTDVSRVSGHEMNTAETMDFGIVSGHTINTAQQTDVSMVSGHEINTAQQTDVSGVSGHTINTAQQTDVSRVSGHEINIAQQTDVSRVSSNSINTAQQTDVSSMSVNKINTAQQTDVGSVSGHTINTAQQTDVSRVSDHTINTAQQTDVSILNAYSKESAQQTDISRVNLCSCNREHQTDVSRVNINTISRTIQTYSSMMDSFKTGSDNGTDIDCLPTVEDNNGKYGPKATETPVPVTMTSEIYRKLQKQAQEEFDKRKSMDGFFDTFKSNNVDTAMIEHLRIELVRWKGEKLDIAITGNSGSGKSSLINSLRGIAPFNELAAQVGNVETTAKPEPYPHPNNSNLILWDLPGVGTEEFPKNTYVEKVELKHYDFFVIVTFKRFTENDAWLIKRILEMRKKVFVVRSHIDADLYNEKRDTLDYKEEEAIEKIRVSTETGIQAQTDKFKLDKNHIPVFLISTTLSHIKKYDFNKFQEKMLFSLPELKKEAMVLTLTILTESAIEQKVDILSKQIDKIGSAYGSLSFVNPFAYWEWFIRDSVITEQIKTFKTQLGLDENVLKKKQADLKCLQLKTLPNCDLDKYKETVLKEFKRGYDAADVLRKVLLDMKEDAKQIYTSK